MRGPEAIGLRPRDARRPFATHFRR